MTLPPQTSGFARGHVTYYMSNMVIKDGKVVALCKGPRDKFKKYLNFHNAFGHKTYKNRDIPQVAPTQKFS